MPQPQYFVRCTHCPAHIFLLETTLAEIVQRRQVSTTGDPLVMLVCQECMAVHPFDYRRRRAAAMSDLPLQTPALFWFSILAVCDEDNCDFPVELVAIRSHGTTEQQCLEEIPNWQLDGVMRKRWRQISRPEPSARMSSGPLGA